jgi:hypothetical protein
MDFPKVVREGTHEAVDLCQQRLCVLNRGGDVLLDGHLGRIASFHGNRQETAALRFQPINQSASELGFRHGRHATPRGSLPRRRAAVLPTPPPDALSGLPRARCAGGSAVPKGPSRAIVSRHGDADRRGGRGNPPAASRRLQGAVGSSWRSSGCYPTGRSGAVLRRAPAGYQWRDGSRTATSDGGLAPSASQRSPAASVV